MVRQAGSGAAVHRCRVGHDYLAEHNVVSPLGFHSVAADGMDGMGKIEPLGSQLVSARTFDYAVRPLVPDPRADNTGILPSLPFVDSGLAGKAN